MGGELGARPPAAAESLEQRRGVGETVGLGLHQGEARLLAENGFLLLLGLGIGAVTALLAVAPHLIGGAGAIPWPELLGMLAAVLVVGLLVAAAALAATLRAPLVPALRRE